jgi:AcrR family transcriptional regulator
MQNMSTKQKIVEAAIRLFNDDDVANVRLQQIADETGISVGNLAYHFKNKEAIISTVYENLFEEFSQILSTYMITPKLTDFDRQIEGYHRFFTKYKFYLIDLFQVDRSYPLVMEQWQQSVNKMLMQIRKRIEYNVNRGILSAEPAPGVYENLANNLWMTIIFWIPQQILKGQSMNESRFKQAVWAQISPFFTPNGLKEFMLEVQPIMLS